MKTKGITIWEQHAEHFALALAVLIFVGLAAMQFLTNPNAVDHQGRKVGPGDVDRMLAEQARDIAAKISPESEPPVAIQDPVPVLAKFEQRKIASINPKPTLPVWQASLTPDRGYVVDPATGAFVVAEIPAPEQVTVSQYFETLQPEVVAEHTELQKRLPVAPHDLPFVTVAARFNAGDVLRQYSTDRDGARALPSKWYSDRVDLVDVRIEREELQDDGSYGNLVLIDPLPGKVSFRGEMAGAIDAAGRNRILGFLDDPANRDEIIQPEFFNGLANYWMPPNFGGEQIVVEGRTPEETYLLELKSQLTRLQGELERVKTKLDEFKCPEQAPETPKKEKEQRPEKGGGANAPGGDLGMGGMGGRGARGHDQGDQKGENSACKALRTKKHNLETRIEKLELEIAKLAPKDEPQPEVEQKKADEPMPDVLTVWGHDITVEPGKTYRYRMTIHVYNPLFLHKADLMPEQQPLAEQFMSASKTSEWTQPKRIDPPLRVFVVGAQPRAAAGVLAQPYGQATADVFRYFNGRWWSDRVNVMPGQRIGEERAPRRGEKAPSIDFGSEWFVLDVVENIAAERSDVDKSLGAVVILQNLNQPAVTQRRDPRFEKTSSDYQRLKDMVAEANLASPIAAR